MNDKIKLLVIDDDPSMLDLLGVKLKNDFEIFLTDNPEEGARIMKDNDVQIALTDIVMPDQDGIQVLQLLRKQDPTCTVLAMTAVHEMNELIECLSNGFNDYFSKPLDLNHVVETINYHNQKYDRWAQKKGA